jgi:uncharacterized protein (DUF885 family)
MKQNHRFLGWVAFLLLTTCAHPRPYFSGTTEGEKLRAFFSWSFQTLIERQPQEMTFIGMDKKQDQLNQHSYAFDQQTRELLEQHRDILLSFDRDQLNRQDRLNYDLYRHQLDREIESFTWYGYRYPVNQMSGIQSGLPSFMINMHRVSDEQDLQNYIKRLWEFQRVFSEVVNQLMRSEAQGVVPPRFVFPKVIDDSKNIISGRPFVKSQQDSPLYADFKKKLQSLKLSAARREQLTEDAEAALLQSVGPAYASLIEFLQKQEERATTDHGVWKFPKGDQYYRFRLREMTTLDWEPEEIHQLGLKNVARIHQEMRAISKKVSFKGDLPAFFKFMQGDRFLFADTPQGKQQYLQKARAFIKAMQSDLDRLFVTQPKAQLTVKAVEPFREKSAGMAFYQRGTPDGKRPGTYYVNLSNMKALPRWEVEALAYHEGLPGHHMQISIAQERPDVPQFRRFAHYTSYSEGWGLYSERFPKEFGYYQDPYSDFGRLSMELTRACRLVVDTGLHFKKWTREQAITYLDKNLPGDHDDNVRQINRYIVMPGQATAYLIGMLKILELREKAKTALGEKFEIKKFHEVILTNGPVPLPVLETLVDEFIISS